MKLGRWDNVLALHDVRNIMGNFKFLRREKIQKNWAYHSNQRAKYSHKQTCYLPGVSPARIRTQIRLLGLLLRTSFEKTSPGGVKYEPWTSAPLSLSSVYSVICTLTRYTWPVNAGNVQFHPRVTQVWESFSIIRCSYVHTPSRAICTCILCASLLKWLTSDYWQPEAL